MVDRGVILFDLDCLVLIYRRAEMAVDYGQKLISVVADDEGLSRPMWLSAWFIARAYNFETEEIQGVHIE